MNNVRELRKMKGIQQKELAIEIGVSNATVSDWEHGRKNPSGERLERLAEYFGVEKSEILGESETNKPTLFIPKDPKVVGVSETEQIISYVLEKLNAQQPKTPEARILASGIDRLPKAQREQALNVVKAMFTQYADYFENGDEADDT